MAAALADVILDETGRESYTSNGATARDIDASDRGNRRLRDLLDSLKRMFDGALHAARSA